MFSFFTNNFIDLRKENDINKPFLQTHSNDTILSLISEEKLKLTQFQVDIEITKQKFKNSRERLKALERAIGLKVQNYSNLRSGKILFFFYFF